MWDMISSLPRMHDCLHYKILSNGEDVAWKAAFKGRPSIDSQDDGFFQLFLRQHTSTTLEPQNVCPSKRFVFLHLCKESEVTAADKAARKVVERSLDKSELRYTSQSWSAPGYQNASDTKAFTASGKSKLASLFSCVVER